ncbi:uncharacterized protein [Haliotis asinina]|uniref:uncharacterized protein n=1 Tax=Haliotis asinina TaxID=109174 RepID=UPI003531AD9B
MIGYQTSVNIRSRDDSSSFLREPGYLQNDQRPNREPLHQYQALANSLENIHTVLSVCELEQREIITQQVLDLVWTVQEIEESIIEEAVTDTSLASPEGATDMSLPSQEAATDTSPEAATDTSLPSPEAATDTSLTSPETATDTSLPSPEAATDSSLPSPEAATDTSLPSPEAATDASLPSPETATDMSLPSPEAATITSLPSPEAATDASLPSLEAATGILLASPEAAIDMSLTSPEAATITSLPSLTNRNSSLCLSVDSDLEPSVSSPPSTSNGVNATLVNTEPLTPVSSHTAYTPLANVTGILPFFKLAGQKIASLNQRSSPCKNTCSYHTQRQKWFKGIYRTDNPTDSQAKQIPMNERVTLPPKQTTDEVIMQPSPPPPAILTRKPFLCASSFTPNKASVTEISQETSAKRGVLKSKDSSTPHGSSAHQSQTFLTWKASFLKTHTPKLKISEKVKVFQLTPDTRTDSWRKLSETEPAPMQKVIKSNEKTVPQAKDMERLNSKSTEVLSRTRSTSSLQPWRSSSKHKSLVQPFKVSPLSQSPPALCSFLLSSVLARPGSCGDPESIRERTRNANILMMNESEEGENSFGSEFWDLRTVTSESHSVDFVTDTREGSTKPVLPSRESLPQSDNMVSDASPTFESAKRKLIYNENKRVPLKKRFNPNFRETSMDDRPCKSSGKPGTPYKKQMTPKQKSRDNGKPYTPKTTPTVHGKVYTPNTKPTVTGEQQVTPRRKYPKERKSYIEETSRTSRARQPIQSASVKEELVQQLEEILRVFMAGGKQATTKMLTPNKQNQLIEFARLCYISAVKTTGGVRLRKTSASRAPISLDREWMLS